MLLLQLPPPPPPPPVEIVKTTRVPAAAAVEVGATAVGRLWLSRFNSSADNIAIAAKAAFVLVPFAFLFPFAPTRPYVYVCARDVCVTFASPDNKKEKNKQNKRILKKTEQRKKVKRGIELKQQTKGKGKQKKCNNNNKRIEKDDEILGEVLSKPQLHSSLSECGPFAVGH